MSLELDALEIRLRGSSSALFQPLSLRIAPGEIACVMGPSGIGKSTLLDAIGGHLGYGFSCTGVVRLDGRDLAPLPPEARRVGLVFQDAGLFPHLSVADNLAFGLRPTLRGRHARQDAVEQALRDAGLAGMGARDPATLSGGQRMRAALMRTLLSEPRALLLDEPFSGLDADRRAEMRRFVHGHIRERAIPTLLVTHDPEDASATGGDPILLRQQHQS